MRGLQILQVREDQHVWEIWGGSYEEGDGATRFSTTDGKPILHFLNTSTFTEYTVVDSACVVKIRVDGDGDLNPYIKRLTLLNCGVSTGKKLGQPQ